MKKFTLSRNMKNDLVNMKSWLPKSLETTTKLSNILLKLLKSKKNFSNLMPSSESKQLKLALILNKLLVKTKKKTRRKSSWSKKSSN